MEIFSEKVVYVYFPSISGDFKGAKTYDYCSFSHLNIDLFYKDTYLHSFNLKILIIASWSLI